MDQDTHNYDMNIFFTYYENITKKVKAEISYIKDLINHNLTKGIALEELLKDLLIRFLPKRYSIGSGIIFDKSGHYSKQIDIIIYDSFYHAEMLGQGRQFLFPVDIVYATIEVKANLDMNGAIKNIKSVKKLEIIDEEIKIMKNNDHMIFKTNAPYGIIFAFRSSSNNFEEFRNNSLKLINEESEKNLLFDSCYILENTFSIRKPNLDNHDLYDFCFYFNRNEKPTNNQGFLPGPEVQYMGQKIICDQSRGFLLFLLDTLKLLSHKYIIKDYIFDHYISEENFYQICQSNKEV